MMDPLHRTRLLVRVANILKSQQYEAERDELLTWADELLAGEPVPSRLVAGDPRAEQEMPVFPLSISRVYKHTRIEATLLPGWRVQLNGAVYPSPSAAAVAVSGHPENGWRTWKYQDPRTGQIRIIDSLRH